MVIHLSMKNMENIFSFQARTKSCLLWCFTKYRCEFLLLHSRKLCTPIGSWKLNPYLSFTVSAVVELFAYVIVHLILDRIGRKIPYVTFVILFGIVALLSLPVQKFTTKESQSKTFD